MLLHIPVTHFVTGNLYLAIPLTFFTYSPLPPGTISSFSGSTSWFLNTEASQTADLLRPLPGGHAGHLCFGVCAAHGPTPSIRLVFTCLFLHNGRSIKLAAGMLPYVDSLFLTVDTGRQITLLYAAYGCAYTLRKSVRLIKAGCYSTAPVSSHSFTNTRVRPMTLLSWSLNR